MVLPLDRLLRLEVNDEVEVPETRAQSLRRDALLMSLDVLDDRIDQAERMGEDVSDLIAKRQVLIARIELVTDEEYNAMLRDLANS